MLLSSANVLASTRRDIALSQEHAALIAISANMY